MNKSKPKKQLGSDIVNVTKIRIRSDQQKNVGPSTKLVKRPNDPREETITFLEATSYEKLAPNRPIL